MASTTTQINPRQIDMEGDQIANMKDATSFDSQSFILDKDWAKRAFLINDTELGDSADIANRYWSSASAKYTDTRLGANIGINARPQFTRYSDNRIKGRIQGRKDVTIGATTGDFGMGRYYSEAIDDPSQTIYMRFGVPQFNGIVNFLLRAFDPNMTSLAKTGRDPSFLYEIAKVAGTVATVIAAPPIAITIVAGKVISSFFTRPTSKFYTMKPTMHLYWSAVNMLVNTVAINRGILPKVMNDENEQKLGRPYKLDQEHLNMLKELLPDTFKGQNYFDVFAIANKAQRMANKLFMDDYANLENGTATKFLGFLKSETGGGSHATYISDDNGGPTFSAVLNKALMFGYYKTDKAEDRMEQDPRLNKNPTDEKDQQIKEPSFFQEFVKHYDAEVRDGGQYAIFKVSHTGQMSESFGNSVGESDLANKLNGVSSSARQARFSFAEGNLLGDGGITGMVQGALSGVGDVLSGLASGITFGAFDSIKGFLGSGYVDIPKYWQSSTATLPRSNYKLQLISPYGNPISQMQNIYIPLCMLLAGTLPLSTGKQSYTSPFLCQIFDRGRCQVRLGMIESLSITRGTSNLAFDLQGHALAIEVSFSVVDLSSVMHMPISSGSLLGVDMTLDEDNILCDYLAVLAGQDLYSAVYPMTRARLNLAKKIMQAQKLTSPAYWSSFIHDKAESSWLQFTPIGAFQNLVVEVGARGSTNLRGNM